MTFPPQKKKNFFRHLPTRHFPTCGKVPMTLSPWWVNVLHPSAIAHGGQVSFIPLLLLLLLDFHLKRSQLWYFQVTYKE